MPARKNRNAYRQSLDQNPSLHSPSLFHDFNTPSLAPPADLPIIDSDPELLIARTGEQDLIDMHANAVRDLDNSGPLIHTSPHEEMDLGDQGGTGHIRSPVMAREPTMLESFSRAVRNYIPSSIPISTAAPAPPRISRPIPVGNFMPSTLPSTLPALNRPESSSGIGVTDYKAPNIGLGGLDEVFGSDEDETAFAPPIVRRPLSATSYPGVGEGDMILWSRWDELRVEATHSKRLLFLGYSSGLQIWDCTCLGSVSEILNISGSNLGRIVFAGVLPSSTLGADLISQRPLIGAITHTQEKLLVYSLRTHQIVKSLIIPGLLSFSSNDRFIVVCTINPPSLQVLSSISFETLHVISSTLLVPFTQAPQSKFDTTTVSVSDIDVGNSDTLLRLSQARPVFSLSHRLLAFASVPPSRSSAPTVLAVKPRSLSRFSAGSFSMSQAELSHAALKVGGSVLSGMKSIGGLAYSAAKSRVTVPNTSPSASGLSNHFFSKSAPTSSNSSRERRTSVTSFSHGSGCHPQEPPPSDPLLVQGSSSSKGYYVTVLDMTTLLNAPFSKPTVVAEFIASKQQSISHLEFASDGNSLVVSPKDGQMMRIFHIKPPPAVSRDISNTWVTGVEETDSTVVSQPWHVYDLRRGRTSAVVESVSVSEDGMWAAVGTKKRTVHLFAINPYGGKPDQRSHLEGRVQNVTELEQQPLSTEVLPLVRLRTAKPAPEQSLAPVTFIFVKSCESSLPTNLFPPATIPNSLPMSVHSSPVRHSEPLSSRHVQRPTNFLDVLLFDPVQGILSLRRLTLEIRTRDQGLSLPAAVQTLGNTSVSLPGVSPLSRLGVSPPVSSGRLSSLTQMIDTPTELVGRDSAVASWHLRREQDWGEIRHIFQQVSSSASSRPSKINSLAHAELSTSSRSYRVLPRPIYLSHQFSFYALGEDYHTPIRRFRLDIGGCKIEVRKEVEVSAYSTGTGESFVEGFSAPRDTHGFSTSFDEPLASALSASLDHFHPSRAIIPMLPNGMPGSKPKSFRSPVPIRNMATGLSDGVSESIGRIRREIHKVRSPQLGPRPDTSESVPLEFDEEDEDFLDCDSRVGVHIHNTVSRSTSRGEGDSGASVSTPSTSAIPLDDEVDDLWRGWNTEDKSAIDEVEQFDDVVGFLDEEQTPSIQAERTKRSRRRALW